MKKNFISAIILPLVAIFAFYACSQEENKDLGNEDLLTLESFEAYGKLHNEFMTNVKENFVIPEGITTHSQAIDYINDFNRQYATTIKTIDGVDKEAICAKFTSTNKFKVLVDNSSIEERVFPAMQTRSTSSIDIDLDFSISDILLEALNNGNIDKFEYENLLKISEKVYENMEGKATDEELINCIFLVKDKWVNHRYTKDSKYGSTLGTVLAISLSSIDWWNENPDAIYVDPNINVTYSATAVVSADVAGAIVGAVWGGITGRKWSSVGTGAVTGAISSSTGIVGKIGRWLSKLF